MVLSDPAKSGLEDGAWIDGYQNEDKNNTIYEKIRVRYFSVQCIIAKTM